MARSIIGVDKLERRLAAIQPKTNDLMKKVAVVARGEMILAMRAVGARKTGTTAGSIEVRNVTPTHAELWGSPVLRWIDEGTGLYGPMHRRITPVAANALAFSVGSFGKGGSLRLTGKPRKGAAGRGASLIVVKSVAGMQPRPYIRKSVLTSGTKIGIALEAVLVEKWNGAA